MSNILSMPTITNLSDHVKIAVGKIDNYNKSGYLDKSAIRLGVNSIEVRVIDHNNPLDCDDELTKQLVSKLSKITSFVQVVRYGDGTILMNHKDDIRS